MRPDFSALFDELTRRGIVVTLATLEKHSSQGFMSGVFVMDSSAGPLVLHALLPNAEQKRQKTWEKAAAVWQLLEGAGLPVARVYASVESGPWRLSAQQRLPGIAAGERVIEKGMFIDHWNTGVDAFADIEKALAQLHSIPAEGYGWIVQGMHGARGTYKTLEQFLLAEIPLWLGVVAGVDPELAHTAGAYFFPLSKHTLYSGPASLIHNDATNPSNILVEHGRLSGIIDWEWALAGDPAWEFGFNNEYQLEHYFAQRHIQPKERAAFYLRMDFCKILFLLWGTYMHSTTNDGDLYKTIHSQLTRALLSAPQNTAGDGRAF